MSEEEEEAGTKEVLLLDAEDLFSRAEEEDCCCEDDEEEDCWMLLLLDEDLGDRADDPVALEVVADRVRDRALHHGVGLRRRVERVRDVPG